MLIEVVPTKNDAGERVGVSGNPVKFPGKPVERRRYPPALGEHTAEILASVLGLSDEEIAAHLADGVVFQAGE